MTKKINKKILLLAVLAVLFFGAPSLSLAKNIDISLDQTLFALNVEPGQTYDFKMNVLNNSDNPREIQIFSQDYDLGEKNTVKFREQKDSAHGISAWISVSDTDANFTLAPQEKKEVVFSLKIPPEAEVGSHRGAVLAGTVAQEATGQFNEALLSGRVGAHVLINVAGEVHGSGKIYSFKKPFFFWKKMLIAADFENTGNVHYIPHGELLISNLFTKHEEKVDMEKHFVFPGESYAFEEDWRNGSLFGIYSVQAAFVDGDGAVHLESGFSLGIFFLPMVIVLFFGLYLVWKKWQKRTVR